MQDHQCWILQPSRHAATRARLRRRKSAFRFHLIAANSRPETEDPGHARHRDPLPPGRDGAVARRELPQCAEVPPADQRRRIGADLLADQPVLRRCAAAADRVRGRGDALHHREHHRAAAHRGHPAVRRAAKRRPVRSGQDDPVHALSGDSAGHAAGHQHRGAGGQRRAAAGLQPGHHRQPEHLHPGRHRAGDDRGRGAGDVDGRVGHRAGHR